MRFPPWPLALLLSACALPFQQAAKTPLARVSDNYISLSSGIPMVFGYTASAVIVADGLALTNRHVVEASPQMQGLIVGRGLIPVEVIGISERMDLALLRIPRGVGRPVAPALVRVGDPVWLMGTSAPFTQPTAIGKVENERGWSCSVEMDGGTCSKRQAGLVVRAQAGSGYSGGPIVDRHGHLVAITQGTFSRAVDAAGNEVRDGAVRMFAYRIDDVLAEVATMQSDAQLVASALLVRPRP